MLTKGQKSSESNAASVAFFSPYISSSPFSAVTFIKSLSTFFVVALGRHDHAHEEDGWDTESQDSIYVGADDLEVHEGNKELLVAESSSLL